MIEESLNENSASISTGPNRITHHEARPAAAPASARQALACRADGATGRALPAMRARRRRRCRARSSRSRVSRLRGSADSLELRVDQRQRRRVHRDEAHLARERLGLGRGVVVDQLVGGVDVLRLRGDREAADPGERALLRRHPLDRQPVVGHRLGGAATAIGEHDLARLEQVDHRGVGFGEGAEVVASCRAAAALPPRPARR